MKKINNLEYLKLNKFKRLLYKIASFFIAIPVAFKNLGIKIWHAIKKFGLTIKDIFVTIGTTFAKGSWKTRVSYFIMGFGNISRKQYLKGLLFLLFEGVFTAYMFIAGGHWLAKFATLGTVQRQVNVYIPELDQYGDIEGDDSFKILLYGLLTILFIVALVFTWYLNVKQNKICDEIEASGKKVKSNKDDLRSLVDDQFHKTLLSLPLTGILLFTVIPIIFMVLVAFTNYDKDHDGYANLFTWVGLDNFNTLFSSSTGSLGYAFGEILAWTLMWAVLATFTNYFLGMAVAMLINKKGIRLKKMWRTILVMTIAIPQFISLIYVSNMFYGDGIINGFLKDIGLLDDLYRLFDNLNLLKDGISFPNKIDFWGEPKIARILVVIINIWVGIPYVMLISTGVLMNIPQDLYESAKIDGANVWDQYVKITLPYMLFVTGPYLLTSFIGNINNFNIIYLLTGGGPANNSLSTPGGNAGDTDLLITWLFNITTGEEANYKVASVVGILIFIVVAILSLIIYNVMPSTKNEEDFS